MSELVIRQSIEVEAPAETMWRVLTDNDLVPQYMFGCVAETDWKPRSPLLWRGAADGKVYVKGAIVACDAPRRLAYTVIDPNGAIADVPENYLTMTCTIQPRGPRACTLELTQGDFATVANGAERYRHSQQGDEAILAAMKALAEKEAGAATPG